MAFTKYAAFEVGAILDVKGSASRARHASLSKLADFDDYRTEDGYLYARIRAISSRVNKNHDGWPSIELAGDPAIFDEHRHASTGFTVEAKKGARHGFSTFLGKPIFVDHHNSDPKRARGVIVDTKLHVEDARTAGELDPYYASSPDAEHMPPTWVELLLEVDAKAFPKFAKALIAGSKDPSKGIDGFSMGCDVERSVCNICKNSATSPHEFCDHIRMKGAEHSYRDEEGNRKTARSYENCYGVRFFEISGVFDPADDTALGIEVRSNVRQSAGLPQAQAPEPIPTESNPPAMKCPQCAGLDSNCPSCHGVGALSTGMGGDGYITPARIPEEGGQPKGMYSPVNHGISWDNVDLHHMNPDDPEGSGWQTVLPGGRRLQGARDPFHPDADAVLGEAQRIVAEHPDISLADAMDHATRRLRNLFPSPQAAGGDMPDPGFDPHMVKPFQVNPPPKGLRLDQAVPNNAMFSTVKETRNPAPQADLLKVPAEVNTLRQEELCPRCGTPMEDNFCDVCKYSDPPEHFDTPDLGKAKENRDLPAVSNDDGEPQKLLSPQPTNHPALAHVTGDMEWSVVPNPHLAARINSIERPVNPGNPPSSNEPKEKVIRDEVRPVTSQVRTAGEMLAAVGRDTGGNMDKVADSVPATAAPDKRTDATGVGGVMDASNEEASKADAQVDVEALGGTGVEDVEADRHDHVDHGDEHTKNIEGTPTDTWHGTDGNGVTQQEDPVSSDPFPSSDEGVKSAAEHTAYDSDAFPKDDGDLAGGSAVKGVKPVAETFGDRVNVLESLTSPENNSGPTTTWHGTDGNGVLKQQEPVTTEVDPNITVKGSGFISLAAVRLAELEIELGLLKVEQKWARLAELADHAEARIAADLAYAERVRTAGLRREAKVVKQATKLPVLGRSSSNQSAVPADQAEDPLAGTLFGL